MSVAVRPMDKNGIRLERVWVTPAMAKRWLAKNPEIQRKLNAAGVRHLEHLMLGGCGWKTTI